MVNYNEGKIYKIMSNLGDKVYYGSTTKKRLCDRMTFHRCDYKRWLKCKGNFLTSIIIFEEYGIENCSIVLVEAYPCNTKDELRAREAHYIKNFECVNKNIPNRTIKEWREDNKYKIVEQTKQYREANKDKITEYREVNKDKMKRYYEDNKDKIAERAKQRGSVKINCICGSCFRISDRRRHERSLKHIEFMKTH
jgi:hypothetical protein